MHDIDTHSLLIPIDVYVKRHIRKSNNSHQSIKLDKNELLDESLDDILIPKEENIISIFDEELEIPMTDEDIESMIESIIHTENKDEGNSNASRNTN